MADKDHLFKEGNQFWKLRSKHGRDTIIKDPKFLSQSADEYFQLCIETPIITFDYRGKDNEKVFFEHPKVFKKEEFARFCDVAQWRTIEQLKEKSDDFLQVITRIENIIADQKYEFAVVGIFKENIIARDLGLKDERKLEVTDNTNNEKIKKRIKQLEKSANTAKWKD